MKAPVFLVIHMCQTVKSCESVGRHTKPTVRIQKFVYPQKTHVLLIKDTCFVNKKIIRGTKSNGFWFIKQKNFVLKNDHWMRTSIMVYHTLACALCGGSR